MTKKAFDKIAAGLNEAVAFADGDMSVGRLIVPAEIDVAEIRKKTDLTQKLFANLFGFTLEQVRQWEQGRSRPLGSDRAYLMLIESDHQTILAMLRRASAARAAA